MAREKRRIKYVDSNIQGQLAVRTLLHWVFLLLVCCTVSLALQFLLNPLAGWHENAQRMWAAQGPIVLVSFCLFPLFVRDTISFSHRFVGPVTRIRNVLRVLGQGGVVQPVKLRPHDYWTEVAEEINQVIAEFERLKAQAAHAQSRSAVSPPPREETAGVA